MSTVAGDELMGPVSDKSDEEVVDLSGSLVSFDVCLFNCAVSDP